MENRKSGEMSKQINKEAIDIQNMRYGFPFYNFMENIPLLNIKKGVSRN